MLADPLVTPRARTQVLGLTLLAVLAALLAGCTAPYSSQGRAGYPTANYAAAPAHPTAAEQAATLLATQGYRRILNTASQALTAHLAAVARDAGAQDLAHAKLDELAAQASYDVLRGDIAADSATAMQLDGESWGTSTGVANGLHAIEQALWTSPNLVAARRLAVGLETQSLLAGFIFFRAIITPAQMLSQAQSQLSWAVDTAVTGREELFSHLDLVDVAATAAATQHTFELVVPLGRIVAPGETALTAARFAALTREIRSLGASTSRPDASIGTATWRTIAAALDAVDAPLGSLSGDVTGFGTGRLYA